jgi:VWFA-related protein
LKRLAGYFMNRSTGLTPGENERITMRMKLGLVGFLAVAVLITTLPRPGNSQATSQTNCLAQDRKKLLLTAIDKTGRVVTVFRKDDLNLQIGNKSTTILEVVFPIDEPFDLGILIDTSVSQEEVLPLNKLAAGGLVSAVGRGQDRIALVSFSNAPKYEQSFTTDTKLIVSAMNQLKVELPIGYVGGGVVISRTPPVGRSAAGSTSLWDATRKAIVDLFGSDAQGRQRAIVLFTDGQDTSSTGKLKSVIDESLKHDVSVYVIGAAGSQFDVSRDSLKKLSDETGGVARFPKKATDYDSALTEILRRLSAQYRIAYCGIAQEQAKLDIEVVNSDLRKLSPVLAYRRH